MWGGLTPKDRSGMNGRENLLKPHGSWIRYRQGCRCSQCVEAHNESTKNVNLNMSGIPYMTEPIEDIEAVRFGLI